MTETHLASNGETPDIGTAEPEVVSRNFNFYYGDFLALKEVTMVVPRNRVTALIGPSGCGKSTFLRAINRMHDRIPSARAIVVRPEVLLMDEPTSALDPLSTGQVEDLAIELKKQYTVVIVTHNMQQAGRISDFTGLFWAIPDDRTGYLVEFGATGEMFTRPKKEETEQYLSGRFG